MIEELAAMAPGPGLAAALARIDRTVLNGHDLVIVMRAQARQVAHEQARLLADMWEVAHCPAPRPPDTPTERLDTVDEFAVDEIRFALGLTRRGADTQLSLAYHVVDRLPTVHAALDQGRIDLPRARVIAELTGVLHDTAARQVADQVLPQAPELTTGQLAALLRRLAITVDPDAAEHRRQRAQPARGVALRADHDGTATLIAWGLPPDRAVAAMTRLTATAHTQADGRTLNQRCTDLLLDLLDPPRQGRPAPLAGTVELTVPLTTLMHLAQ